MTTFQRLQIALGLIWLLDGLLQFQPANLSVPFAQGVSDTAMGQPARVQGMIIATASALAAHPIAAGLAIGVIQLALGAAILRPGTRRAGLLCSIPWALAVWVLGEGFGGLGTGFSMLPSGAPGPALLYALAAIMLLPRRSNSTVERGSVSSADYGLLGERAVARIWGFLWLGAAILQVIPVFTLNFKLAANFQMLSLGEPRWLANLDHVSQRLASSHGVEFTAALVVFELLVASTALVDAVWRRRLLAMTLVVLPLLWLAGENFGGLLSASATDLGAMPMYALLALGLWPTPSRRARATSTPDSRRDDHDAFNGGDETDQIDEGANTVLALATRRAAPRARPRPEHRTPVGP